MTTENTHDEQRDVDTFVAEHPYEPEVNASSTASTTADYAEAEGHVQAEQELHESAHADAANSFDNVAVPELVEASPAIQATEAEASLATPTNEQGSVQEPDYSAPVSTPTAEGTEEQHNTPSLEATEAAGEQHTIVATGSTVAAPEQDSNAQHVPEQTGGTGAVTIDEPVAVEPLLAEPVEAAAVSETATPEEEPVATESTQLPPIGALPLIGAQIEEVRPFTSFLEEFEAQEARIKEAQAEALSLLHTPQVEEPATSLTPTEEMGAVINSVGTIDVAEGVAPAEAQEILAETLTPVAAQAEEVTAAQEQPAAQVAVPEAAVAPKPLERPVSPLLRPPLRPRLPRHGVLRQREEVAPVENTAAQTEPAPGAPAEPEAPRPQRRYRFDNRPSSVNGGTSTSSTVTPPAHPAVQTRAEDSKEKEVLKPSARNDASQVTTGTSNETALKQDTNGGSAHEQPEEVIAAKQPTAQEIVEEIPTQPSPISEQDRRRRHGQERPREKEQPVVQAEPATPATNPKTVADVAALIEPEAPLLEGAAPEGVAPEDMPPLEYAELQKASSRRRRRHRPATVSSTAAVPPAVSPTTQAAQPNKQAAPAPTPAAEQPAAQVTPPVVTTANAPRSIGTSAPSSSQYGIVSGYTVSQMNQSSNETVGPFMGPEPSPARGSIITRDGRTARAESQRSPVYPVARTTEPTVSSTSIQQLASVLAQSIQTQTDRMVAELRRANQAPTNVSVNLPPFPSTERVGVFVDVANLLYSARTLRIAVDFGKLLDFLRGNRRLIRAHAYCPTSPQAGDEQMFLQAVKGLGYRITTKNYKTFSSGAKKADLDLDLCMDVVRLVDGRSVDCIVLVSGDSDFMPMLDYCSDHGVRVEVAAFDEAMSATLRQSCDLFINLSMLEEIRA